MASLLVTGELDGRVHSKDSAVSDDETNAGERGGLAGQLELVLVDLDRRPVIARDLGLDQHSLDVSSRKGARRAL